MRKLSKIFRIASKYHIGFGGRDTYYMCHAIDWAVEDGAITVDEQILAKDFAKQLVKLVCEYRISLSAALQNLLNRDAYVENFEDLAALVWMAVIDKLEFDGR